MTRIHFNEVCTRDGFQIEPEIIPTEAKVSLIDELSGCGYAKIEITSFTSPKAIPMLRDAEIVMGRIRRVPGVEYTVLVPNLRGAERAMEARADELNLVMSTSETHNLANLRMPREHSVKALSDVIRHVDGRTPINVSLSTAFGCPMEGDVPQETVLQYAQRFADPAPGLLAEVLLRATHGVDSLQLDWFFIPLSRRRPPVPRGPPGRPGRPPRACRRGCPDAIPCRG